MRYSPDQWGIVRGSALGLALAAVMLAAGYAWLPAGALGLDAAMDFEDRAAFTLKTSLPIFLWLAGCVGAVSNGRFHSPADIRGSAFSPPSQAIAVRAAVLQNSLEQTVLLFGALLSLGVLMRGFELRFLPLLVGLFLLGRVIFALGYARGASGRALGMVLTAASIIAGYWLVVWLIAHGR